MVRYPQLGYEHVQSFYGLNVGKGTRVHVKVGDGALQIRLGTVEGCDKHVYVRLDGETKAEPYHPNDVTLVVV